MNNLAQPPAAPQGSTEPSAILLTAVLDEVRSTATRAQERGFLQAVGRRIAETFPLTGLVDLDALNRGMNRILDQLGAGSVHLSVDAEGILIDHANVPAHGFEPDIIEGLYAGWFSPLGSDRLILKRITAQDRLVFHYGR